MNAREFYEIFIQKTSQDVLINNKTLFDVYKSSKEYTPVIMGIINEIIAEAGYNPQNEYYRIDAIGWTSHSDDMKEEATTKDIRLNPHLWDLKIAVEHENSKTDWTDEIIKLIHIKCKLKVVIGYNYFDERGPKEQEKLDFIAKWMKEIEAFTEYPREEYLIILGNGANRFSSNSTYTDMDYKGYIYNWDTNRFEEIM